MPHGFLGSGGDLLQIRNRSKAHESQREWQAIPPQSDLHKATEEKGRLAKERYTHQRTSKKTLEITNTCMRLDRS